MVAYGAERVKCDIHILDLFYFFWATYNCDCVQSKMTTTPRRCRGMKVGSLNAF